MKARGFVAAFAFSGFAGVACHDDPPPPPQTTPAPPFADPGVASPPPPAVDAGLPPRCSLVTTGAPPAVPFGDHAELGEVVPYGAGFALGALRAGEAGRVASVLRIGGPSGHEAPLDLGPVSHDAPAPQLFVRGEDLFAVANLKVPGSARRRLSLHRVAPSSEKLLDLPPEADASSEYDVVAAPPGSTIGAVVAWDDDAGTPPRALLQVASLAPDLHSVQSVRQVHAALSTTDAGDAGDPRLASRAGGYWLTWLARRPEHAASPLPLPAGEIETPSEEATYGWVEAVVLDATGTPTGAPRRLTSPTGHVGSYAITVREGALVVVAEQDGAGRAGGGLERVVWHGRVDETPESSRIIRTGVEEETPPAVVVGPGGQEWLTFLDVHGDTQLMPFATDGPLTHAGAARESLLQGGRFLGALDGRIALAAADGARWSLRWMTCAR